MFPISLGRRHLICFKFKPFVMSQHEPSTPLIPIVGRAAKALGWISHTWSDELTGYLADVAIRKQGNDQQPIIKVNGPRPGPTFRLLNLLRVRTGSCPTKNLGFHWFPTSEVQPMVFQLKTLEKLAKTQVAAAEIQPAKASHGMLQQ